MTDVLTRYRKAVSEPHVIAVDWCALAKEMAEECERLQTELRAYRQDYGAIIGSQKGENDRLRAALEEITRTFRDSAGFCDCKTIAYEALNPH